MLRLLEVLHLLFTRHHLSLVGDILILVLLELLQELILGLLVASLHEAFLVSWPLHAIEHLVLVHSPLHQVVGLGLLLVRWVNC